MPRTLSYLDAARLLGAGDDRLLSRIQAVATGVALGLAPIAPGALALLDANAAIARLSADLLAALRARRGRSLGRPDRSQRLAAANVVLVVTAFFETIGELELPVNPAALEFTAAEQLGLAGRASGRPGAADLADVFEAAVVLPAPTGSAEAYTEELRRLYERLGQRVQRFVAGLAIWERLGESDQAAIAAAFPAVPQRAVLRYQEHLRRLAADFPEAGHWTATLAHAGTRSAVRALEPSLARLERSLAELTSGTVAEAQALSLARAYAAELGRPIAESGAIPGRLRVPTLADGYLPPPFRVAEADAQTAAGDEDWWAARPLLDDIEAFLLRYLTSAAATEAPLLVLGQPGGGKSVLTRVLAARLPAADFLVVRVPLRDVAAELDIQGQIELAIHQLTGERIAWPALVRSHPAALPVVLIDGFDELLQATGVRHTDYLARVAEFQRREAVQGRPAAVLVTTRTSVADRALPPLGTALLRLEPFDESRIDAWVTIWNATNADALRQAGLQPLALGEVLLRAGLASQPLLLLMLALYDAEHNALSQLGTDLELRELYERLLVSFTAREVAKRYPGLGPDEFARLVEDELRHLSIVAFAMFNRARQWITQADLDADLDALFPPPSAHPPANLRSPATRAELALGRFFFVHRGQARRDAAPLYTYEFLHATFGEYLVARLAWQLVVDTAARARAAILPTTVIDDELLYTLLSFAPLTSRRPTVDFLLSMIRAEPPAVRAAIAPLLIGLLRAAGLPRRNRALELYAPRLVAVSVRHAAYSANLVLLLTATSGTIDLSAVFDPAVTQPAEEWRGLATLWQSQLNADMFSIHQAIEVERIWTGGQRDIRLSISDGAAEPPPIDPEWTYGLLDLRAGDDWGYTDRTGVRRRTNFVAGTITDTILFHLEPVMAVLGRYSAARFHLIDVDRPVATTAARALIDVWLNLALGAEAPDRHTTYVRCAEVVVQETVRAMAADDAQSPRQFRLLLFALANDGHAAPETTVSTLEKLLANGLRVPGTRADLRVCAAAVQQRVEDGTELHRRLLAVLEAVASIPD